MVACKYFLNGSCRFGSKCVNDHLDIRQLIKTEVEAALKGSQWPLSCFGPFKEKRCIPNFIEDQSVEEIRWSCYEAKQQNTFPAFEHQFKQRVLEAQEKMKTLLNLNRPIVDVVVAIYDQNDTSSTTGESNINNNNNGLQAGSLFGPPTNQQNPFINRNSTNIGTGTLFGRNPQPSGTTPAAAGGLFSFPTGSSTGFGSSNNNNNQQLGSVFGGNQQQMQQGQTNIFGGFTSNAPPTEQSGNNLFSSINQQQQSQQTPSGGSIFGNNNNATNQASNMGSTSLFGSVSQPQNAFGINSTNNQQGNLFMQSQQPTQNTGNLFVQQNPQNQQNNALSTGLFGQQQPQTQPVSNFGQNQNAPVTNASLFGQQQQNIFAMQQQQQHHQQQHQQNIFNSPEVQQDNQHPQFLQGGQQQNVFSSPQPGFAQTGQFSSVQNPTTEQNTFGNILSGNNAAVNGNMMNSVPQANLFQQVPPPPSQIGNPHILSSSGTYSKIEDLTPEELEAFKADTFVLGKIPTKPPPRELIN